jgi:protein-disulfide isomerase
MAKKRKSTSSSKKEQSAIQPGLIIGVVVAAVLIVGGLVLLGNFNQSAAPVDLTGYPSMGDPNAKVTVVEYADFGCSHCRDFNLEKLELIKTNYVDTGKIQYVVHPYYLGNPQIAVATEAALCAGEQGQYFEYEQALFQNQGSMGYDPNTLTDLAASLGLAQDAFRQCLSNRTYRNMVENGRDAGINRGVSSTPTFFVNNRRVEGNQPYDVFAQIIDQELSIAQ